MFLTFELVIKKAFMFSCMYTSIIIYTRRLTIRYDFVYSLLKMCCHFPQSLI